MCIKSKTIGKRISDSKVRAKKKNIEHNITTKDINLLLMQSGDRCPLTQQKFVYEKNHMMNISLDRIDSSKGYIRDNVWVISTWANKAKLDLELNDFKEMCKLVSEAQNG